ncbi:ATP-binding cassette domain-containing protein [Aliiroseovarius sp. S1123]|jgi:ABC-2 type transport system ATP-binding protein|uniref:ATP-binding cassette domain-containing protein n=1 Tax=unclassified Aliiroseovarius TaxID=2623558 RepID=UPI001FF66303|nr:ATP-binding cassette domain-containing protein [Aliiroseovarius sp. S1123]MCK0169806.1 ATP-binding cassette domain-containing protein [Aliiroseovarius sp. S1123]
MTDAVVLENVDLSYGSRTVLSQFSLRLAEGSFTALLGPNGAGKSTIFNLIAGLLLPDRGDVRVMGQSTTRTRAGLRDVGMVFQQSALDLELSVVQNLRYFAGLHGMKKPGDRIQKLLAQLGLEGRERSSVRDLNGGHRRRLEIARALLPDPKILLLDEPTTGLDPASKQAIVDSVHAMSARGVTVLWITHLLDELWPEDEVIVLQAGQIASRGGFAELGGAEKLSQHYAGHERPQL